MTGTMDTTGHEPHSLITGRLPVIGIDEGGDNGIRVVGIDMIHNKQKGNLGFVIRMN